MFDIIDISQYIIFIANKLNMNISILQLEFILYVLDKKYKGDLFPENIFINEEWLYIPEVRKTYRMYIQEDMYIPIIYEPIKYRFRNGYWDEWKTKGISDELKKEIETYMNKIKVVTIGNMLNYLNKDKVFDNAIPGLIKKI